MIHSPDIEYHLLPSPQSTAGFLEAELSTGREGGGIKEAKTLLLQRPLCSHLQLPSAMLQDLHEPVLCEKENVHC